MKHQFRPSILNGMLLGLALAVGIWGVDAMRLRGIPIPLQYPSLLAAGLSLVLLGGVTGWVTGHFEKAGWVVLVWLLATGVASMIIFYRPTIGRTLTIWLADSRFRGKLIYPFIPSLFFPIFANFFTILSLLILALLQNYRLSTIKLEMDDRGHFSKRGWWLLLLPLPMMLIVGVVTNALVVDPTTVAVRKVQRVIEKGREYEGDLFALGLEESINYSAIEPVRDRLAGEYRLVAGSINPATTTLFVTAHFASGEWIKCRVINDQLSFCDDTSPPFTTGLLSLIRGEESADCRHCLPKVAPELQSWLQAQSAQLGATPVVNYQAHWGDYVLVQVNSAESKHSIECWFSDGASVTLTSCTELDE